MEEIEFVPSARVPEPEPEGDPIDMDAFEVELEEELQGPAEAAPEPEQEADFEDEAFLMGALGAGSPVTERLPVSLNQFVGGGADFGDDDEYSSSEDSEDD